MMLLSGDQLLFVLDNRQYRVEFYYHSMPMVDYTGNSTSYIDTEWNI